MNIVNKLSVIVILAATMVGCTVESNKKTSELNKSVPVQPLGKPSAPISMSYKILTESPKAGDEIEIQVRFQSRVKSPIKVQMDNAKNLTWHNSSKNWEPRVNKSGLSEPLPLIKISAPKNGLYYVNLIASVKEDGQMLAKPFTIPVRIGEGSVELDSTGEVMVDENGQKIIVHKIEPKKK